MTARPDPLAPADGRPLASIDEAQRVLGELYFKYQRKIGPFASQAMKSIHALPKARADIAALVEAARAGEDYPIGTGDGPDMNGLYFSPAHAERLRAALEPFGEAQ